MTAMTYRKGYVLIEQPDEASVEYDTFMCTHCNQIIIVQRKGSTNLWSPPEQIAHIGTAPSERREARRRKRQRGFCFRCMGPTCGHAACARCIPFEARMEAMEGSRRFWDGINLLTGERQ